MEQPLDLDPLPPFPPAATFVLAVIGGTIATLLPGVLMVFLSCIVGFVLAMVGWNSAWGGLVYGAVVVALVLGFAAVRSILQLDVAKVGEGLILDRRRVNRWNLEMESVTGAGTPFGVDLPTPDLMDTLTLSGFDVRTPDRRVLARELVRIGLTAFVTPLCWLLTVLIVTTAFSALDAAREIAFIQSYALPFLIPLVIAAVAEASTWHSRRNARWTQQVTLEASVLRTDGGTFHIRGPFTLDRGVDVAGSWMRLKDDEQSLTFGAPFVALDFVEVQLGKVAHREGTADEVPAALRRLSTTAMQPDGPGPA